MTLLYLVSYNFNNWLDTGSPPLVMCFAVLSSNVSEYLRSVRLAFGLLGLKFIFEFVAVILLVKCAWFSRLILFYFGVSRDLQENFIISICKQKSIRNNFDLKRRKKKKYNNPRQYLQSILFLIFELFFYVIPIDFLKFISYIYSKFQINKEYKEDSKLKLLPSLLSCFFCIWRSDEGSHTSLLERETQLQITKFYKKKEKEKRTTKAK